MLRFMTASDQLQSYEDLFPAYCLLFRASTDSIMSILSYLSMTNICRLDAVVTNTSSRIIWLSVSRGTNHRTINNHKHSHGSKRWLVEWGISPEYLETNDTRLIPEEKDRGTLLGLDISSPRNISLRRYKIGDEVVLSIAHGSPNLEEIKLTACYDITDACMIALGKCCQLIFIDIERCNNI